MIIPIVYNYSLFQDEAVVPATGVRVLPAPQLLWEKSSMEQEPKLGRNRVVGQEEVMNDPQKKTALMHQ